MDVKYSSAPTSPHAWPVVGPIIFTMSWSKCNGILSTRTESGAMDRGMNEGPYSTARYRWVPTCKIFENLPATRNLRRRVPVGTLLGKILLVVLARVLLEYR
jgi:hypothetical protein